MANALSEKELAMMDAYWRASNYLSVGQIYLYDNPLLKQPLTKEHIKPRLLGHWGTSPGLNFIYDASGLAMSRGPSGKVVHSRSRQWFDEPSDPGMTALYLERYLNFGLTRKAAWSQGRRQHLIFS